MKGSKTDWMTSNYTTRQFSSDIVMSCQPKESNQLNRQPVIKAWHRDEYGYGWISGYGEMTNVPREHKLTCEIVLLFVTLFENQPLK